MLEFLWPGGSKSAPQVPKAEAQAPPSEARPPGAEELEKTAPPPESNPEPVFEQSQVLTPVLAVSGRADTAPDQPASDSPPDPEMEAGAAARAPDPVAPSDDGARGLAPDAEAGLRRYQRRAAPGRRLVKKDATPTPPLTAQQRLLLLDTWRRSGLPAGDFAALVGVSKYTLYAWKQKFEQQGPAGLMDQPRGGPKGSKLPDLTQRTILLLKQSNPTRSEERR